MTVNRRQAMFILIPSKTTAGLNVDRMFKTVVTACCAPSYGTLNQAVARTHKSSP